MVSSWSTFLRTIRGRRMGDAWASFRKLARVSERDDVLEPLIALGERLDAKDRTVLAVGVARLLELSDWPAEWLEPRALLLNSLDALVHALATYEVELRGAPEVRTARVLFEIAAESFNAPCHLRHIPATARLCNTGLGILQTVRWSELAGLLPTRVAARFTVETALAEYAEAAAGLNRAVGVVYFEGLHVPLRD